MAGHFLLLSSKVHLSCCATLSWTSCFVYVIQDLLNVIYLNCHQCLLCFTLLLWGFYCLILILVSVVCHTHDLRTFITAQNELAFMKSPEIFFCFQHFLFKFHMFCVQLPGVFCFLLSSMMQFKLYCHLIKTFFLNASSLCSFCCDFLQ